MKRTWHVHVGAHKTATTHLQHILETQVAKLRDLGVDVLPYAATSPFVRSDATTSSSSRNQLGHRIRGALEGLGLPYALSSIDRHPQPRPVVLFSHEDQLGFTQDLLRERFYLGSERLGLLDRISARFETKIFLSVRSFDSLFISAFSEILKPFPDARVRLENRRRTLRTNPPSWLELAERLAHRYPEAQVCVWRFEDFVVDPRAIVEQFVGRELDDLEVGQAPGRTQSPSPRGIELAEGLSSTLSVRERMSEVQKIYDENPKTSGETIDILSPDEIAWLQDEYERDCDRLRQSEFVKLIEAVRTS